MQLALDCPWWSMITRIIVLDRIGLYRGELFSDSLLLYVVCCSWTATRRSLSGLALRRTSIDLVRHGEHQRRPASGRRSWSGRVDRLGAVNARTLSLRRHVLCISTCTVYALFVGQLGREVSVRLVLALVLSCLDYCNAVLACHPAATLTESPAILVLDLKPRDRANSVLRE